MRGTSLHKSHEYAKPLNSAVCCKSCNVTILSLTVQEEQILIYEWRRKLLREIDGLMFEYVIFSAFMLSSHSLPKPSGLQY